MTERTPRIDSISLTFRRKRRRRPELGDRKVIRGVLHERQMATVKDARGVVVGYDCTGGRQQYEWVPINGEGQGNGG